MNAQRNDTETERKRRLRMRNLALCAALLAFVAIVYTVSIVRMGGE